MTDFEWVVVDGDSSDGTKAWLGELDKAKWISEPDSGIFNAMNKGLKRAQGEYLVFMNSGDSFASDDVLEQIHNKIKSQNRPEFVYGDSIDVDENKDEYYRKAKHYKKNWMGMITQHQAMFFSKKSIGKTRYIESYPITADYAFISEVLNKLSSEEILKVNFPVCKFDMGGTNEQHRFKALKEDFDIRRKIIKLPFVTNSILYLLHYTHTILKKLTPGIRFIRHKSTA